MPVSRHTASSGPRSKAKSVSIFYCFPRSGGTLLNQCLLCAPANVVLSEVNPADSVLAPEKQAAEWFGLLSATEVASLESAPYLEKLDLILEKCRGAGRRLCLRDWTGINFLDHISPWTGAPSCRLEHPIYLGGGNYEWREIALMRRSRAVYQSLVDNIPELAQLKPEDFGTVYRAYLEAVATVKKYRLEDFLADRTGTLQAICRDLDLEFAADFEQRFHTIETVTGNNTLRQPPASAGWKSIQASPAAPAPDHRRLANHAGMFAELDSLAGYEPAQSK